MLAPKPERMSFDEYIAWEQSQDEKWELIDGVPVRRSERWWRDPVTGMAGARPGHNRICANLIRHLGNRLAGGKCVALPSDQLVRSPTGNSRYPDVVVECGVPEPESLAAAEPRILFEVLSPSNTVRQQMKLIADYQAMLTVQQVVFVEQSRPGVLVWTRGDGPWTVAEHDELDAILDLPSIGVSLPLAEIYEGLNLEGSSPLS